MNAAAPLNWPLIVFGSIVLGAAIAAAWFFRAALEEIGAQAREHARTYAVAYVKCAALMLITAGAAFDETFRKLTAADAAALTWWGWVCLYWKPIAAALGVLVAFLDSSVQRAQETRAAAAGAAAGGTPAPFPVPTAPPKISP